MQFQFRIVRVDSHDDRPLTFHVSDDGGQTWMPSMKRYPECNVPGLSKDYYVQRCIDRLKRGASSEAFGGHQVQLDGPDGVLMLGRTATDRPARAEVVPEEGAVVMETVMTKNGPKQREVRKRFVAKVDGKVVGTAPTEAAAKGVAAIYAFMTRNKLGRVAHVLEKLQECFPGRACKVWACCERGGVRATVDGEEYAIGWLPPEKTESRLWEVEPDTIGASGLPYRFKKLVQE